MIFARWGGAMEVLTKPTSSSAAAGASSSPLYNAQCFAMLLWAHGPHNGKYHLHHYDHYVGHWPTFNVMGQGFLAIREKIREKKNTGTSKKYGNFHGSSQIIIPKALISQKLDRKTKYGNFQKIRELPKNPGTSTEVPR